MVRNSICAAYVYVRCTSHRLINFAPSLPLSNNKPPTNHPGRLWTLVGCVLFLSFISNVWGRWEVLFYFVVVAVLLLKIWEEDGVGMRGSADNNYECSWQRFILGGALIPHRKRRVVGAVVCSQCWRRSRPFILPRCCRCHIVVVVSLLLFRWSAGSSFPLSLGTALPR